MSRGRAAALLTLLVVSNMAFGLLFGRILSLSSAARMPITLTVIAATAASWAVTLAWPGGHPPLWLLVLLIVVMGSNGPASLVGLEYARVHNPGHRLGTASGIANMGGFLATIVTLLGVGVLLDAVSGGAETYSAGAFRLAFCWLYVPMLLGTAMILRLRRKVAA
jgi:hypothetical protein